MRRKLTWAMTMLIALIAFVVLLFVIVDASNGSSLVPRVTFSPWPSVDRWVCPAAARKKITERAKAEGEAKFPELLALWEAQGPGFLEATTALVGKPFRYEGTEVGVVLCPALPAMAIPAIVPLARHLPTLVGKDKRWADGDFVVTVWHELLHMYIIRLVGTRGYIFGLLEKYSEESPTTKFHLHLYAIQKAVFLAQGKADAWQRLVGIIRTYPPAFKRALEIIERDGYEPFIADLRGMR